MTLPKACVFRISWLQCAYNRAPLPFDGRGFKIVDNRDMYLLLLGGIIFKNNFLVSLQVQTIWKPLNTKVFQ
jgi:hypothetical protein